MRLQDPCQARVPGLHVLILPGWQGSGPDHWQSLWERHHGDRRVEQHDWHWPLRGDWMMRLDETIADLAAAGGGTTAPGRIALAAHSLGCHLVSAWAAHSRNTGAVGAALLVAPPDLDRPDLPPQLHSFVPAVRARLPFPAALVYSDDDPFCGPQQARELARDWGAQPVAVGACGHLNAASGLAGWPAARHWLAALLAG